MTAQALLLLGLEDEAMVVRTPVFDEIASKLAFTVAHRGTMMVAGDHGAGKRVALLSCLAEQPVPYVVVPMPPSPSPKDVIRLLYDAIHADRDEFALRDMQDELVDTLSGEPRIVVIDTADELNSKAAAQLHYLHSRANATWSLLLLGGPEVARVVTTSAGLRGELIAAVHVAPLHGEELLRTVRGMHQLYNMADAELLQVIDQQLCGGLLKSWAQFLQTALYLRNRAVDAGQEAPVLDVEFARAVTRLIPQLRTARKR